jgi:hypothetical protein
VSQAIEEHLAHQGQRLGPIRDHIGHAGTPRQPGTVEAWHESAIGQILIIS